MKQIEKYEIKVEPEQTLLIPFNSEILGVFELGGKPYLWVIVDGGYKNMPRKILMFKKDLPVTVNKTKFLGAFEHKAQVGQEMLFLFEE